MNKKVNLNKVGGEIAGVLTGMENKPDITPGVKEQESKGVKEEKPNSTKVEKIKRSFMLTNDQVELLYILKSKNPSKDLSEIVGEAIEKAFKDAAAPTL
jgi:hypothetical protein